MLKNNQMQYSEKQIMPNKKPVLKNRFIVYLIQPGYIVTLTLLLMLSSGLLAQLREPIRLPLNTGWTFREANEGKWMNATVPGCVHTDLMDNKIIPDVYWGNNADSVKWIENKDWEYKTSFTADEKLMDREFIDLIFEGLDTYADVFVNETKVLEASNMFIGYTVNVKPYISRGTNTLRIYFYSAINKALPLYRASNVKYPADNDDSETKISVFTRKAAYQYGWDIAPRMVGCGIWRPVKLEAWSGVKINSVSFKPVKITTKKAKYDAEINLSTANNGPLQIIVRDYENGERTAKKLLLNADNRTMKIKIPVNIKNPEMWWPNGSGVQPMYDIDIDIAAGNNLYKCTASIGVRTVEVINSPDQTGKSFYLKVNGLPMYMKGANYVPMDLFPSRISTNDYLKLFAAVKQANFNMIRVWGGGIYESDEFYRFADENGILIWQDFMFSGCMYPSDSSFMAQVKQEAEYNVKRLSNHPSLALWCGNNEIQVAWDNWGWQKKYNINTEEAAKMYSGYKKIFHELLPSIIAKSDSGRFYFPSSPQSNWGNANALKSGDNHYWGVWHGEEPVESYLTNIPRFTSEFGLPSLPGINTLARYVDPDKLKLDNDAVNSRMRSYKGLGLLKKYTENNYGPVTNLEEFWYKSNILQAEAITKAIEAQRASKPFCMGSLYWQLNDCWPGITWSSINWNGEYKALQYAAAEAFQPVLITQKKENNNIKLVIINDRAEDIQAKITLRLINFKGDVAWNKVYKLKLKANENLSLAVDSLEDRLKKVGKNNAVLQCILYSSKGLITSRNLFFEKTKLLNLPEPDFEKEICEYGKGYVLSVRSKTVAKNVSLNVVNSNSTFSENFFDMMPGELKQIVINSDLSIDSVLENLKIVCSQNEVAKQSR